MVTNIVKELQSALLYSVLPAVVLDDFCKIYVFWGIYRIVFRCYLDVKKEPQSPIESDDFFVFPKHLEMLGDKAKDCGVSLSLEWTGMEAEASGNMGVTYLLYRCKKKSKNNGQTSLYQD